MYSIRLLSPKIEAYVQAENESRSANTKKGVLVAMVRRKRTPFRHAKRGAATSSPECSGD